MRTAGRLKLRRSLADYLSRKGTVMVFPRFQALSRGPRSSGRAQVEPALARIDEGLATAQDGGQ